MRLWCATLQTLKLTFVLGDIMLLIILTILSLISAIASGVYAYYTGNVGAEMVCVGSMLALSVGLCVMAFGGKFEGEE